jgi:hypothetical protein
VLIQIISDEPPLQWPGTAKDITAPGSDGSHDSEMTGGLYFASKAHMKAASVQELKRELLILPPKQVIELCLKLVRFKKENKELLSYLLFDAHDPEAYVLAVKQEMDQQFAELPTSNWFIIKKALRKILRGIAKSSKHTNSKEADVEMMIHFCVNLKNSGIRFRSYKALSALYEQQLKKLHVLVEQVHEDLRFDYKKQLERL